jgi:hypothetical protein
MIRDGVRAPLKLAEKLSDIKQFRARHAGMIAAGLVAVVLFFIVGAGIRLLMGPVSLAPFSEQLSQSLATALPGISVHFDQAALGWSRADDRVDLVVLGARVFDTKGRVIAQAPRIDLGLEAGALINGKVVVQRITLIGVQLTLVRTRTGGVRLGVTADKDQPDLLTQINDAINASSGPSSLQSIAIRDARLALYDEVSGLFVVAPQANLRISSSGINLIADLDAEVEITGKPAHIKFDLTMPPKGMAASGHMEITNLDLNALGRNAQPFSALKAANVLANLSADLVFSGDRIGTAKFALTSAGNVAGWGPHHTPLALGTFRMAGDYNAQSGRVTIDDASAAGGQVGFHMQGGGQLLYNPNGMLDGASLDATADHVTVNMPAAYPNGMKLSKIVVQAHYTPATHEIDIAHLGVSGGTLNAEFSGKITLNPNGAPAIAVSGKLNPMPIRDLVHFWPQGSAEGARSWLDRNVAAGTIGTTLLKTNIAAGALDLPALPNDALSVTFTFQGVTGTYIKGLTPATQATGSGKLSGDTFAGEVTSARVGPLLASNGHVNIPNLHVHGTVGMMTAHVTGQMSDLLTLIDMKPLNYPTRFHINPADTKGTATVDVAVKVPMLHDVGISQIGILVTGQVNGLDLALGKSTRIQKGVVQFMVDNSRLHANGDVFYSGEKLNLDWTEVFADTNDITSHVVVKAVLDAEGRKQLGLDTGEILTGPLNVVATLSGHRGVIRHVDAALDMTPSVVSLDIIGISKAAGVAGDANVSADFAPTGTIKNADFKVDSAWLTTAGNAKFDANGNLASLNVPRVNAGPANDFSLAMTRGPNNSLDATLRGHSINGAGLAGRGAKGSTKDQKFDGPFKISAHLDKLALRAGVAIAPFNLDVSGIEDRLQTLSLSGSLSHNGTVSGSMTSDAAGRKMLLSANDAGTFFKGLFGFTSIKGGKLAVAVTFPRPVMPAPDPASTTPDFQGEATLKDFRVLHQSFLVRIFTAGSLLGFINLMSSSGIEVDTLSLPFTSKKGVLSIRDARASGPAIGVSADGYIDRPNNVLSLRGSIAPLYGVNSILGMIPLLGNVLTSKEGEGVVGMTYTAKGNADEPDVSVNPLSILTPGILRRIFEGRIPTPAEQQGTPAQPAPQKATAATH